MSSQPRINQPDPADKGAEPIAETLAYRPVTTDAARPAGPITPSLELQRQPTLQQGPSPPLVPELLSTKASSLNGQRFDDFELLEEIGRGGMGVVYKGHQVSLNRPVAIKLLLNQHFRNPTALTRFHTEARAAANLAHPNIVQVYQFGESPLGHYLVMEYIDGQSLETLLARGPLAVASAVALLVAVAETVQFAHSKGILHRDLKPANIMIDKTRRPIVMDFGIAKFVGESSALTQEGTIMGTPAYMAPEQAGESPEQVGTHSDVYALGAILYTALTGRPPYHADTALRTVLKVIAPEMPPAPSSHNQDVPPLLDDLCLKCLSKTPAGRPASARLLSQELRRLHASLKKGDVTLARGPAGSTMRTRQWSLVLVSTETGKRLRLVRGSTVIGRTAQCDITLRASDVSKRHCQIDVAEDTVTVEDLESANGTFVNNKRVQRATLQQGDRLRVADHEFTVCLREPAKEE
jgi:serine/threonine protein kinase